MYVAKGICVSQPFGKNLHSRLAVSVIVCIWGSLLGEVGL